MLVAPKPPGPGNYTITDGDMPGSISPASCGGTVAIDSPFFDAVCALSSRADASDVTLASRFLNFRGAARLVESGLAARPRSPDSTRSSSIPTIGVVTPLPMSTPDS